ncbi:FKBP-type peptidyl-prolyl cis-trans isomerase [Labilithrix luteola]|nr:FKBP-type peptidyl-prolyl cis-trans isomerase [Labilithrix luteola]
MKIEKGSLVQCEYELRVVGGEVLESSSKTGPISYVHGRGKMLAALEERLVGMSVGEERKGKLSGSSLSTGVPDVAVPRSLFPKDAPVAVGSRFEAKDPKGRPLQLEVKKVDKDTVTARAIHPLEGKELEYRVKVLSVRKPPPVPASSAAVLDADDLEIVEPSP